MITTVQQFIELTDTESPDLRWLGRTLGATTKVWNALLRDYPEYWGAVALNKSVPVEILDRLAACEDERVRETVAMRRKISLYAMRLLSKDASSSVRSTLVRNPKIDLDVLREMTADEDTYVASEARERLSRRDDVD